MDSMTSVYYLRHAESAMNVRAAELVGGRSNHAELSPRGPEQAVLAGRWLTANSIIPDTVSVSPAVRTRQTAIGTLRAMELAVDVTIDPGLQELSQGVMEGRLRHEVWTPEAVAKLLEDPMNFAFEGGDSFTSLQERMRTSYDSIITNHPNETVLVVGHGLAIRAFVGSILGWSHADIMAASMPNCGLTLIEHRDTTDAVSFVGRDIVAEQLAFEQEKV